MSRMNVRCEGSASIALCALDGSRAVAAAAAAAAAALPFRRCALLHPHPRCHAPAAPAPPGGEFKLLAVITVGRGGGRDLAIGTFLGVDTVTMRPLEVARGEINNPGNFLIGRRSG